MKPCYLKLGHTTYHHGCRLCTLSATNESYARMWGDPWPPEGKIPAVSLQVINPTTPCSHLGKILSKCPLDDASRDIRECAKHHTTTLGRCEKCPDHTGKTLSSGPQLLAKINQQSLPFVKSKYHINTTLIDDGEGYIMAWRDARAGARIHCVRMTPALRPIPETHRVLRLTHPAGTGGREDPRLFRHDGKLHLSYCAVRRDRAGKTVTTICYAILNDSLEVVSEHEPILQGRTYPMEKNWSFFSHEGQLHAVYLSNPEHVILRIDGNRAERVHITPNRRPWSSSQIRGGCSPVLHDGEYWHWFHSRGRSGPSMPMRYDMGLIRFEAKAPFRVTYQSTDPVYRADMATWKREYYPVPVWFPCGAVRRPQGWVISGGVHESWSEIRLFTG